MNYNHVKGPQPRIRRILYESDGRPRAGILNTLAVYGVGKTARLLGIDKDTLRNGLRWRGLDAATFGPGKGVRLPDLNLPSSMTEARVMRLGILLDHGVEPWVVGEAMHITPDYLYRLMVRLRAQSADQHHTTTETRA